MKVAVWLSDRKWKKLNFCRLEDLLSAQGHEVVRLDMDQPLEPQGPFAAILHRVSDAMGEAEQGDLVAKRRICSFEKFIDEHPEVAVFDPIAGVRVLMNRKNLCVLVAESDLVKRGILYAPPFVELTSTDATQNLKQLKATGLRFPLVCKPLLAHGAGETHMMSLVFNDVGVKDVRCPCIAQSFIQHNARLFKLFVMHDKYYVAERPSLKNFVACDDMATIHFHTHNVSKPDSSSLLNALNGEEEGSSLDALSKEKCDAIVKEFREKVGLTLFGIDVIVERGNGRHAVIDINFFPGYEGVQSFMTDFADLLLDVIESNDKPRLMSCKAKKATPRSPGGGSDLLADIDTFDASDEKKTMEDCKSKTDDHSVMLSFVSSGIKRTVIH